VNKIQAQTETILVNQGNNSKELIFRNILFNNIQQKSTQNFGGKAQRKRPFKGLKHELEDGIEMDLRETGLEGVGWIQLAPHTDRRQDLVNMVMNLRVLEP
jgi:hypothetical protein